MPPGVDFPKALVEGLIDRCAGQPPDTLARVHLIVNTRRMARRIRTLFDEGPARLLPRVSLVTDLSESFFVPGLPPVLPKLRRRLELARLISTLLDAQPDLAPRVAIYDLADSLAALLDEMEGEGVTPETIRGLDVSDMSGHWARAQAFIGIAEQFASSDGIALDSEARQRLCVERLIERWQTQPPSDPLIVAGSTGSRGTTLRLMEAVARLPRGAVVLPGFDFDQPPAVWAHMHDALTAEDHPQYRFRRLMDELDLVPGQIERWTPAEAPSPPRNRAVSLALRPAPVTDAWLTEGPELTQLETAFADVTLVEAENPRGEALAIALRLRQAAEDGQTAALITPDRMLTRQVTAALDRWGILPDDSAGMPLHLSPPGRFLRHVAQLLVHRLDAAKLLGLLKHPLCHSGGARNLHLLMTRDLELHLRKNGPPYPTAEDIATWAAAHGAEGAEDWGRWAGKCCDGPAPEPQALARWVATLCDLSEHLAGGGGDGGSGTLWDQNAGQSARAVIDELEAHADAGDTMSARDFADLLHALLRQQEVRDRDAPHPKIMIWGTLEARVQGADLMILGGLNENSWPEAARPDPWLNRALRAEAGLLLPERRIGLSAHDFQQAIAANEVWLTRARRSDDAETVASRWLNRLTNLLGGLDRSGGPAVLAAMRARGDVWTARARMLDDAPRTPPAPRPSPRPPVSARPDRLSVTDIKRLIRDPYAIYARRVLRLNPLDPLVQEPDARLRGIVVHSVLEAFVRQTVEDPSALTEAYLLSLTMEFLARDVPWPTAQRLWQARLAKVAGWFVRQEQERQAHADPALFEARATRRLDHLDFTLTGVADRIDRDAEGAALIYDYKTGQPPSAREQEFFDKQLLLEAAMAKAGGFADLGPAQVRSALFIGLNAQREVAAPLEEAPPEQVWAEFEKLIAAYRDPEQGFTARRMVQKDSDVGDFDHLARFGEWDRSTDPTPEDLT